MLIIITAVTLQAAGQDFSASGEETEVIGTERLSPADKKVTNNAGDIAAYSDSSGKPNVIIILTDDQGYGDLSVHGNPALETPNIDKLHEESIRFTDFHVAPMCTPTRSQLMTGQDALSTGAFIACCGFALLDKEMPTMADVFKASNYETGLFGKWHLGDNYPYRAMDRGFKGTVMHKGWGITSTADYWNNDYFDDYYWHNGELKQYEGYVTDGWFSEAMSWMREQGEKGRPFFTYLSINAPHAPLYVPDEYRQIYLNKELPENLSSYFGMVANIDDNVGRLNKFMKETRLEGKMHLELKEIKTILEGRWLPQSAGNEPREMVRIAPEIKEKGFNSVGKMTLSKKGNEKQFLNKTGYFDESDNPVKR